MMSELTIAIAQVNPTVGAIAGNLTLVRNALQHCVGADLVVFPELVVCGYPPEDLVLMPSFVRDCMEGALRLAADCGDLPPFLLTTPWEEQGRVYNAALLVENGVVVAKTFKNALPNYGVFDEMRTFLSGGMPFPMPFRGKRLGVMICEDMWFPDAAAHLKRHGADILIVPNGSPFELGKQEQRLALAQARVAETGLPLLYVNQIGGQDDLVFDGGSFALNAHDGGVGFQVPQCEPYVGIVAPSARWGEGVTPAPDEAVYAVLKLALKDYVAKNKFPGVLIGMSGGIDSALSAAIAVDALGADKVRCIMMPSPYTSKDSLEDAHACAKALGCYYDVVNIGPMMEAFGDTLPAVKDGVAHENMQSRLRGLILMSLSNANGHMVLTTGNKSEMACGYATLYGDMCGGYNVLKDVYKTLVYRLAAWRNDQGPVIPARILTKAPSAELRENQTDQDSLPPYDILDGILYGLIEQRLSPKEVAAGGFDIDTVRRVRGLLDAAEYKRRQSAPGPKITPLAFGRDRRVPITRGKL